MKQRAEQIKNAARNIAGCDITIRTGEVEPMLAAGWDAIPVGAVVYADTVRVDGASKIYVKAGNAEITGQVMTANGWITKTATIPSDAVKNQMLDSYITRSIIGAKKQEV